MSDTVLLQCANAPCNAPGDLHWETPDDVVEVPEALAVELLRIGHMGFHEVAPTAATAEALRPVEEEINPGYQDYSAEGFSTRNDLTRAGEGHTPTTGTPEGQPKLQESIEVAAPPNVAKKAPARKAAASRKKA